MCCTSVLRRELIGRLKPVRLGHGGGLVTRHSQAYPHELWRLYTSPQMIPFTEAIRLRPDLNPLSCGSILVPPIFLPIIPSQNPLLAPEWSWKLPMENGHKTISRWDFRPHLSWPSCWRLGIIIVQSDPGIWWNHSDRFEDWALLSRCVAVDRIYTFRLT